MIELVGRTAILAYASQLTTVVPPADLRPRTEPARMQQRQAQGDNYSGYTGVHSPEGSLDEKAINGISLSV